jgi:four helix bundle protein
LGESFELETQMIIAERVSLISNETAQQLEADISEVQKMIIGFKAKLNT